MFRLCLSLLPHGIVLWFSFEMHDKLTIMLSVIETFLQDCEGQTSRFSWGIPCSTEGQGIREFFFHIVRELIEYYNYCAPNMPLIFKIICWILKAKAQDSCSNVQRKFIQTSSSILFISLVEKPNEPQVPFFWIIWWIISLTLPIVLIILVSVTASGCTRPPLLGTMGQLCWSLTADNIPDSAGPETGGKILLLCAAETSDVRHQTIYFS